MPRNTLICTVGTSLFDSNLKNLSDKPDAPVNWRELKDAFDRTDWKQTAAELLKISPSARVCGAEINTVEEIRKKNWLALENLIFLVSDTPAGRNTGKVLSLYFKKRTDLNLHTIEFKPVDELQDERPKDFRTHGLRNLVREMGAYIQRFGGADNVAIDATGGYKAQIAIAVLIGQAINIPVYYKHEKFNEIIDFPPMPVSLDYEVLAQNAALLTDFERGKQFSGSELGELDRKLRVMLTEIIVDGESLYELGPIGQIYLTGFRLRNPKPVKLTPADTKNRKPPTFRDDHYPIGFKDFVNKVWADNTWITTINSLPYDKQKSIKGISFAVKDEGDNQYRLVGTYQDKDGFGARFRLHLTDEAFTALIWAADQLNQTYRE
jgi:putative CRISPR-associated protein (TIGR02619 family)